MASDSLFKVVNGLATLRPDALNIVRLLERRIAGWAAEIGAQEHSYPPLQRVEDLSRIDYFLNFPHLGTLATRIRPDHLKTSYGTQRALRSICCEHLDDAHFVLPSAACYSIYFDFENSQLTEPIYVTTIARCYRNEDEYTNLSRLWGFQMRELVCLGRTADVQAHLQNFRVKIKAFTERLGLPIEVSLATDPFFDRSSSRAAMQQIFPVKEEFVYGAKVAIASINFHRNFFGERCHISTADGEHAFTGCVAFGIERWIHALNDHFDGDGDRIRGALESALP